MKTLDMPIDFATSDTEPTKISLIQAMNTVAASSTPSDFCIDLRQCLRQHVRQYAPSLWKSRTARGDDR